jgi:hypothetical protein
MPLLLNGQPSDFPFNFATRALSSDSIVCLLPKTRSLFDGSKDEKKQVLASAFSNFWKSLNIWHFDDKDIIHALFFFDATNKLISIKFSSSGLLEMILDKSSTSTIDELYFKYYGIPLVFYLQKYGWHQQSQMSVFPIEMIKRDLLLTIKIETINDLAANPEEVEFSGFHFHFQNDHIPVAAKYLRFEIRTTDAR